jgi:hypothetical protein
MKTFALNLFFVCLIIGTLGGLTKVRSQNKDATRATQLWEQVISAKGGRERLYAVNNLVVSSRTKYSRPVRGFKEGQFENLFVFPDKWWFWGNELGITIWTYDFGRQVGQELWDASLGVHTYSPTIPLTDTTIVPFEKKDDITFRFVRRRFIQNQLIYLMETKWLQPTIVKSWESKVGNKKVDVIETSYAKQRFEFYIDPKTSLPVQVIIRTRIEQTGRDVVDRFVLGDYIEVAGIKFPQKVTRGDKNKTTYQVNVDYDERIFERPPTIDMGPEAWRRSK